MRVLLISPNTEMLPDPVFPLGLAYLATALEGTRHEWQILDICFENDHAAALECAVEEFRPEAVGLSLRNVDNVAYPNSCSYLPFYREIVQYLRRLTKVPVILGGAGFSLMPQLILTHLQADFGIYGEGERSLVRLLDRLADGLPAEGLPGIIAASALQETELPPLQPLAFRELSMPRREPFDCEKYLRFGGMGNLQTKRGCPFTCEYCAYPIIEGRDVRLRPPAQVAREIEHLCRLGISSLFIVDDIFNFPPHHAKSVCVEIIKKQLSVRWSCYLHPKYVTESLLQLMKDAGCSSVEFGTDSGSSGQLKRLGKSFTRADVRRASALCHKVGIPFCHSLLFGGPGENRQTIQETFDLMAEVSPTAVIAMTGIRLFPGTGLAACALDEDLIFTGESILQPTFFLASSCRSSLFEMIYPHVENHRHWILPGSNVNINRRLQQALRRVGWKGPLWEYMHHRKP